jgi:hypothetical protein
MHTCRLIDIIHGKGPKEVKEMHPWYAGFKGVITQEGTIKKDDCVTYITTGRVQVCMHVCVYVCIYAIFITQEGTIKKDGCVTYL